MIKKFVKMTNKIFFSKSISLFKKVCFERIKAPELSPQPYWIMS